MNTPTGQELEIMKILWQLKTATVRNVYETLLKRRKIAYTTVMTMMRILEKKGFLKRWQEGQTYVYQPAHSQKRVLQRMVRDLVDRAFNGSMEAMVVHLVEDEQFDQEKIKQILQESK